MKATARGCRSERWFQVASTYGTDASKSALRSGYLNLCGTMPTGFRKRTDKTVCSMLRMLGEYRQAELILAYLPLHEEIDTTAVIQNARKDGKRVALPLLTREGTLEFYEVGSPDQVVAGSRGLKRAPSADAKPLTTKDMLGSVCLVPGLVFDGEGQRVGYGAGYYDNFLMFYPGQKVGLVRSVQVSSNPLPHTDHDVPVDVLVTEGSIWRCRRSE